MQVWYCAVTEQSYRCWFYNHWITIMGIYVYDYKYAYMFIQNKYVCLCVSWVWLKPWHPGFKTKKNAGCGRPSTQHVVNSAPFLVIILTCLMCWASRSLTLRLDIFNISSTLNTEHHRFMNHFNGLVKGNMETLMFHGNHGKKWFPVDFPWKPIQWTLDHNLSRCESHMLRDTGRLEPRKNRIFLAPKIMEK